MSGTPDTGAPTGTVTEENGQTNKLKEVQDKLTTALELLKKQTFSEEDKEKITEAVTSAVALLPAPASGGKGKKKRAQKKHGGEFAALSPQVMNTQYLLNAASPDAQANTFVASAAAPPPSTSHAAFSASDPLDKSLPTSYINAMGPELAGGKKKKNTKAKAAPKRK